MGAETTTADGDVGAGVKKLFNKEGWRQKGATIAEGWRGAFGRTNTDKDDNNPNWIQKFQHKRQLSAGEDGQSTIQQPSTARAAEAMRKFFGKDRR